jgi:hypothetical protein
MMQILASDLAGFGTALLFFAVFIALPLSIVITLVLIRLFRSRVDRSMQATTGNPTSVLSLQSPPNASKGSIAIEFIDPDGERAKAARNVPLLAQVRRYKYWLAAVYSAAACMHPLVLALVLVIASYPSSPNQVILEFALLYISFFLVNSTPVVLVPTVVLNKRLRFLILSVALLLLALYIWQSTRGARSVYLWMMIASVPTCAVLLLNTRRLRAVGPIVFASTLLFLFVSGAGLFYATFQALDLIGPIQFVRADMAGLPVIDDPLQYFGELWVLPAAEKGAWIRAFIDAPLSFVQPAHPEAATMEVKVRFSVIWITATALGAALSWAFVRWLARSYQGRYSSDQMLTLDVLMLIYTIWMFLMLVAMYNWIAGAWALAGFIAYKLMVKGYLRRSKRPADSDRIHTLLLLRVFGYDRRTQQLLDDLGQRWRYIGPIQLIGGTDIVNSTIEPHEFFEFLNGRLSRAFVKNRAGIERRLLQGSITPDPDGLFRIDDFFCHDDTWQMTVSLLAPKADAVLMDLRGFTAENRGCVAEIEQLIASVPISRIVLLADSSSSISVIEKTVLNAFSTIPDDSPNTKPGTHLLRILRSSSNQRHTLDTLLGLLCERKNHAGVSRSEQNTS